MSYTLILLVLPAFMFLFLGLLGGKMKPVVCGVLGTLSLGVMTVVSYIAAYQYFFQIPKIDDAYQTLIVFNYDWLHFTENLKISLGIMLDPISVMMLVV
ncbi:MAG: NADH-quinone oxidoreductase subunit L, partial [Dysgonomonas sp.]